MTRTPLVLALLVVGCGDKEPVYTDADADGHYTPDDCDDADPDTWPGAPELCDGADNDCDGEVDEQPTDGVLYFVDADDDGHGERAGAAVQGCPDAVPEGYAAVDDDCDDADPDVHPEADELCDAIDNDCDGAVDQDAVDATTWYPDRDSDGYGTTVNAIDACDDPGGYATEGGDCNDNDGAVNPAAQDRWYDGIDQDCAGDSDYDADRDGFDGDAWGGEDCDDADPEVRPGAEETWYDGVDQDCLGDSDFDADLDGYDSDTWGGEDCDDADASISPLAAETDCTDPVDYNCDGSVGYDDLDGDGFPACEDCDDTDPTRFPYAFEDDSDGVDNDCDGGVDGDDPDPPTRLSLTDDSYAAVQPTTWSFPFCGSTRTELSVNSNGQLTFGYQHTDLSPSLSEFVNDGPSIALWWTDLNPASGNGGVYWAEFSDALAIWFVDVPQFGTSNVNNITALLYDTGRVRISWNTLQATSGLAGWSCGRGVQLPELDLTAQVTLSGALGVGTGSESVFYELFSGDADLDGVQIDFCATAGTDGDGDGWTDLCGDPNDADASVTP